MWWSLVSMAVASPDVPDPKDGSTYPGAVAARGALESEGSSAGLATLWALTRGVVVEGSVATRPGGPAHHEQVRTAPADAVLALRQPSWGAGMGVVLSPTRRGLQGVGLALRGSAGPVRYVVAEQAGGTSGGALDWGGGGRVQGEAALRAAWVGHPGVLVAAEVGVGGAVCCALRTTDDVPWPVGRIELGAALPPGPSVAAARAARTPEEAERVARNTRTASALGTVAVGVGVLGAVGTALALGQFGSELGSSL